MKKSPDDFSKREKMNQPERGNIKNSPEISDEPLNRITDGFRNQTTNLFENQGVLSSLRDLPDGLSNGPESQELRNLREEQEGALQDTIRTVDAAKKKDEEEKKQFQRTYPEALKDEELFIVNIHDRKEYPELAADERDIKRIFKIEEEQVSSISSVG